MYKTRTIYVDEKDVTEVLRTFQEQRGWPLTVDNDGVGHCGWANAPTCWYVRVRCTKKTFCRIGEDLRRKGVAQIDPKTIS